MVVHYECDVVLDAEEPDKELIHLRDSIRVDNFRMEPGERADESAKVGVLGEVCLEGNWKSKGFARHRTRIRRD
jgi:hypothetical protein